MNKGDLMKVMLLMLVCSLFIACSHPLKEIKYNAYEAIGIDKRDLFKREVSKVKDEQEDTEEAFKGTLYRLRRVDRSERASVEEQLAMLDESYQKTQEKMDEVSSRIEKLDTIAKDMFEEWRDEIKTMEHDEFKIKGEQKLTDTRSKYLALYERLKISEEKSVPVLAKIKDQTQLFKQDRNLHTLDKYKKESILIQNEIVDLIYEMNASADEASAFMRTL